MEKRFFLIGRQFPCIQTHHSRDNSFSASVLLEKAKGKDSSKWITPHRFNICFTRDDDFPPAFYACNFEWDEKSDTAILHALDMDGCLGKRDLFIFLIGAPQEGDYRKVDLSKELKEERQGKCRLVVWDS